MTAPALKVHRPESAEAAELPVVLDRRDRVVFGELLDIVDGDARKAEELFTIVLRERRRGGD